MRQTATRPMHTEDAPRDPLWNAVERLVDRAPDMGALWWHGLHLIGARRRRELGQEVSREVYETERASALAILSAPVVLERIRESCNGTLVLMKGYEIALLYEDAALRPFADIDLLVPDSEIVHRELLEAGFVEIGDPELFVDIHHQRPLWLPGLPLSVEIHHAPKWPEALMPPSTDDVLATAIPSMTGIDGISTLTPAAHALILAAHSWAHLPLRRIQELVDIAAITKQAERTEIAQLSRRWKIERVWKTTISCVDSLFEGGPRTSAQRVWARHLLDAREQTVFESHVQRWLSSFWALPPQRALRTLVSAIGDEVSAGEGESWREKGIRTRRAVRNAFVPRSEHDRQLGAGAHRRKRRGR